MTQYHDYYMFIWSVLIFREDKKDTKITSTNGEDVIDASKISHGDYGEEIYDDIDETKLQVAQYEVAVANGYMSLDDKENKNLDNNYQMLQGHDNLPTTSSCKPSVYLNGPENASQNDGSQDAYLTVVSTDEFLVPRQDHNDIEYGIQNPACENYLEPLDASMQSSRSPEGSVYYSNNEDNKPNGPGRSPDYQNASSPCDKNLPEKNWNRPLPERPQDEYVNVSKPCLPDYSNVTAL